MGVLDQEACRAGCDLSRGWRGGARDVAFLALGCLGVRRLGSVAVGAPRVAESSRACC